MNKIRVLVVEDSPTMREFVVDALHSDPDLEVIAEAADGKAAIEMCERLRPDVVTLDMMLPLLTGQDVTEHVMAYCPTPIIIVSSSTNRGELFKTYEALSAGAIDVIEKPHESTVQKEWQLKLATTVKLASRVKVITHPRAKLRHLSTVRAPLPTPSPAVQGFKGRFDCIAIGTSTGGPQALAEILGNLPTDFPIPIVIVLHISQVFGTAFADWLTTVSKIPVKMVTEQQPFPPYGKAQAFLAPPSQHLIVRSGMLVCTNTHEVHSCRPSVDVLFHSIAEEFGARAMALLLTGMGRDGARGLLEISQAGGMTIAQDERSSVIFGMPREAIQLGAAKRVLSLSEIASTLMEAARMDARR